MNYFLQVQSLQCLNNLYGLPGLLTNHPCPEFHNILIERVCNFYDFIFQILNHPIQTRRYAGLPPIPTFPYFFESPYFSLLFRQNPYFSLLYPYFFGSSKKIYTSCNIVSSVPILIYPVDGSVLI